MIELGKVYKVVYRIKSKNPTTGEITERLLKPEHWTWTGNTEARYGVLYKEMVSTDALVECGGDWKKLDTLDFWLLSDAFLEGLIRDNQAMVEN